MRLLIVGCGEPSLIARYAAATSCAFEMFSDRSGGVYDVLGMGRSLSRGGEEPEYISRGTVTSVLTSIGQGLRWGAPLGGGDIQRVGFFYHVSPGVCGCACILLTGGRVGQIGGEWMWERGRLLWCHRMKHTRDHLEVPEVRALLGLPEGSRRIEWGR